MYDFVGPGSTIRNGQIKLLSRLGLGGFGEVFLAQTQDGLRAVKVVDTSSWSKSEYQVFNTMLMNEASFLRTLDHPALPKAHGFFAEEGVRQLGQQEQKRAKKAKYKARRDCIGAEER